MQFATEWDLSSTAEPKGGIQSDLRSLAWRHRLSAYAFVSLVLLVASGYALAEQTPADEIAARSGLPASEVNALLAQCDSDQTSMNFCAWRDQLVAERELRQQVERQEHEHPERKKHWTRVSPNGRRRATFRARRGRATSGTAAP